MQLAESPIEDASADADQIRRLAGRLERISLHPVASAFAEFDDGREVLDARAVMAAGVQGRISGRLYRLGKPDWVAEQTGQTLTPPEIGRASCRERAEISGDTAGFTKTGDNKRGMEDDERRRE